MKAIWNGKVIAESTNTIEVEGNHYFPIESVNKEYLNGSEKHTLCAWKGAASYFNLNVEGKTNKDAAWHYPTPSKLAANIKGHVAFWRGVKISN